jgi:hypothetical protein
LLRFSRRLPAVPLPELPAVATPPLYADDETDANESPSAAEQEIEAALVDELPRHVSLNRDNAPSTATLDGAERPTDVAELFRALQVKRTPDGTVTLSAPPGAADALLAILRGLTELVTKGVAGSG